MVEEKWFKELEQSLQQRLDQVLEELISRLSVLFDRYKSTYSRNLRKICSDILGRLKHIMKNWEWSFEYGHSKDHTQVTKLPKLESYQWNGRL